MSTIRTANAAKTTLKKLSLCDGQKLKVLSYGMEKNLDKSSLSIWWIHLAPE